MSSLFLFSLFLSSLLFSPAFSQSVEKASLFQDPSGKFYIKQGVSDPSAIAVGSFEEGLNVTGWGILRLKTNPNSALGHLDAASTDRDRMYGAGFLEGFLTASHIYDTFLNLYQITFGNDKPSQGLLTFLNQQDRWARAMINQNPTSSYWIQVSFILAQFDGLVDGYGNSTFGKSKPLPVFAFQLLNGIGDFFDLIPATDPSKMIDWTSLSFEDFKSVVFHKGHCSALVKATADLQELFAGHSSWFTYSSMDRIFKYYHFDLQSGFVAAKQVSFSSYPGFLVSLDDFYMMDSGLAMIQTTNNIFNNSLYQYVKPQSLFAWQRVRIAHSMARTGQEWKQIFELYNSGTYTNQYMVVDYKLFTPGQPLPNNTLWVVEQIPGLVVGEDKTDVLRYGYWPSYNVAYFPIIYQRSGYPEMAKKYGTGMTYELAPRAKIFRRDQAKVVDLQSFQYMLRYNDYRNDPFSNNNPSDSICARGDLNTRPDLGGCYDTKVTSSTLITDLTCFAINGPTTENNLPPFSWKKFPEKPHYGLPDLFDFEFIKISSQDI